ncbi:MAG: ParB N-terminal domain-containing protein, partial [Candidatus Kerfeldbacteria bacterium]|nr:ParB N-terminal domain-containing protein [Candidatus Kerfeldbacteria bacterium]
FPDEAFLNELIEHVMEKVSGQQTPLERLQMVCNVAMNWIADYVTDPNVRWTRERVRVDDLYLTGTNPTWNPVIIDRCERSPAKLRETIRADASVAALFADLKADRRPILVRFEKEKPKVLDGMRRVIAAIREDWDTIDAYVARHAGPAQPFCEPHVVYDLLKAYHRGLNRDRASLVTALRFLRGAYGNVDVLLRERFVKAWVPDDEIQDIIREVLAS